MAGVFDIFLGKNKKGYICGSCSHRQTLCSRCLYGTQFDRQSSLFICYHLHPDDFVHFNCIMCTMLLYFSPWNFCYNAMFFCEIGNCRPVERIWSCYVWNYSYKPHVDLQFWLIQNFDCGAPSLHRCTVCLHCLVRAQVYSDLCVLLFWYYRFIAGNSA